MAYHADEHERTMAFADIAVGQIRALKQPATPRHYEIWYTYATGYNAALNQTINELLARGSKLESREIESIYDAYIGNDRLTERVDTIGSKIGDEIDQVMSMIEAAAGSASTYSESLADASQQLNRTRDNDAVRAIVENLVHVTKKMERDNQLLESRLNASRQEIAQLQDNLESARNESLTDPLTALANRKFFDTSLARMIEAARLQHEPLSLMMIDVDHFKKFNDTYGHLTGDHVLRLVAMSVKQNVKGQDVAVRYGGEEFAVLLPNTVLRSAITVADHIRRAVMMKELMKRSTGEHLGRITVSIGVAQLTKMDSEQSLIERTDRCLYAAKRNGRNRVICETDPEVSASQVA
ncbi:MAG TPA: diguanylate cyclase [Xanthobacteraceae bacterium]|nr:diguanylate cyclase [Xanthobacteraceae bacterium]